MFLFQHVSRRLSVGARRNGVRLLFGLLMVSVVAAACAKVPAPTSDSTPPKLSWVVMDSLTQQKFEIPAQPGAEVEVVLGAAVMLVASDAEGVHEITLSDPSIGYSCVSVDGELGQQVGPGLVGKPDVQTMWPDKEGMVLDEIFLVKNLYFSYECGKGWIMNGASATFHGSAESFFGGEATATLKVVMK